MWQSNEIMPIFPLENYHKSCSSIDIHVTGLIAAINGVYLGNNIPPWFILIYKGGQQWIWL